MPQISTEALKAIVFVLDGNTRMSLGRDCSSLAIVRDLLVRDGLIKRTNLYDHEVCEEFPAWTDGSNFVDWPNDPPTCADCGCGIDKGDYYCPACGDTHVEF